VEGVFFLEVFSGMFKKWCVPLMAVFLMLFASLGWAEEPLLVYCGAGLMKPMDELKAAYEEEFGTPVQMIYAGSGELFGMIATRKNGDVYIPGAAKYTQDALEKGHVVKEGMTDICYHVPIILTPKGNPGNIQCLEDLSREGLRIALADAKAAAIGKVSSQILEKNGLLEKVNPNVVTRPSTVNQLLIYTATEQVDAVIAWEDQATWAQGKGKVVIIPIETSKNIIKTIPAAAVSYSKRPEEARQFIAFITSPEAKECWKKWGFPVEKPE
jgi:molybdate transport system substrate-binding protein